jgi:hypothetical protein
LESVVLNGPVLNTFLKIKLMVFSQIYLI